MKFVVDKCLSCAASASSLHSSLQPMYVVQLLFWSKSHCSWCCW